LQISQSSSFSYKKSFSCTTRIRKSHHYRTGRPPARAAQVFSFEPGYRRYVSQQSSRVGNHVIAIDPPRFRSPALRKGLHLALQLHACALGTLGSVLAQDNNLKAVMACFAYIFENRHSAFASIQFTSIESLPGRIDRPPRLPEIGCR